MNINLEKIKSAGFAVELSKDRSTLAIFPTRADQGVHEKLRDVACFLGFNDSETDQFFGATHHIQVMSAIRKASNW